MFELKKIHLKMIETKLAYAMIFVKHEKCFVIFQDEMC